MDESRKCQSAKPAKFGANVFKTHSIVRAIVFVISVMISMTASAQDITGSLPEVIDARVSTTPERARLIVDLTGTTQFAIASLTDPMQIAVDVRATAIQQNGEHAPSGTGIVSGINLEMADTGRARTWIALATPARVQQAYVLEAVEDQPARLVVDFVPATEEEFIELAARDLTDTQQSASTPVTPAPVSTQRRLIVIDPGHGGDDGGATSPDGTSEKEIVLAFSKILQKFLTETGKFDVALTREDDVFIRLEDRIAIARENRADLFVSVHADYFQQDEVRGTSIYTRSPFATSAMDRMLADRENKVDMIAGFATPATDDQVVNILVDLMKREMRRQSFQVAETIVDELGSSVTMRKFPVRQADFLVLQSPDVPSILVELGFLSNPEDIANLTTDAWRNKVAEGIATGITEYFDGFAQ